MKTLRILWVDDEIEHLKPFVMFLENEGHDVTTITNGSDAIDLVAEQTYDLMLLDEMMPGMDGLTTLREIKKIKPFLPVVMVTKSEEQGLMDDAIASQIADYLIKPINPNQIVLAIKKLFHTDEIRRNKIGGEYAKFSAQLNQRINSQPDWDEWRYIYSELCRWDIELDELEDKNMFQMHYLEKKNSNAEFCNYVMRNYADWLKTDDRPTLSFDLLSHYLLPALEETKNPVYFVVLDCMRLDQFQVIEPYLRELFDVSRDLYYSILPTATPYSRNSIFSGLLPADIEKNFPDYWVTSSDMDNSRNRNEHQLLGAHIRDLGFDLNKSKYIKIFNVEEGNFVARKVETWNNEELVILVYNFLDLLAHHRSKSQILKEAIPDEEALRAFTKHWFLHSTFYETLKLISKQNATVVITSDHGSIRVTRACQIIGDKDTSTSVRYKVGKNLNSKDKNAHILKEPSEFGLPQKSIIENYVFAREDYFFVYPNSFHHYMNQFSGTFQHGGVSMEEMILPVAICKPKP
jgi:CheY-like chemotaxis protein